LPSAWGQPPAEPGAGAQAQGLLAGYCVTPSRNGRVRLYRDSVAVFDRQRNNQAGTPSSSA